ncbi:sulfotransferase family protein [Thalassococcus sp. CAU 1522]|uniref:Sulfotransferase family protein n=1 Tax=Thalassococcus arenae TaxID=2851652 RepID=A0ABS6NAP9_9RHOB|nr:sulfotransferase family protein [Thalassococcus arenae]MBV2361101.1 sulfotransferase family protein [Thalassococcus arenae]
MSGTFFLGLGGQKCGSSWMQAYLARQPGSDFGRLGEYQIWEADLGGPFARYRVVEPSPLQRLRGAAKRGLGLAEPKNSLRWRMQTNRDAYFRYFNGLLAKPDVIRTGDITPSYAALPAQTLAQIRDGFATRGVAVKALFSMRDPVARLRSHLRMDQQKGYRPASGDESADLRGFFKSEEAAARMRYDRTLDALEQVFDPDHRFVCLFEELFTPAGIAAFAAFCGVPADPAAGARQVNARHSGGNALPDDLTAEITAHYAPVYRAVARRLPQIATLWPSARFVPTNA